jgi:anaerobic selenocysteine-containing dehydrogenase
MPPDTVFTACPHDCPSTCALEVERLDDGRIGRVRGARDNSYTDGVICAKVARYAERVHHPDRLSEPLRRVGEKGVGRAAFEPVSWDDALEITAAAFEQAVERDGREAVFPYHYAGTMGLVMRDGLDRFRHALGYSRQHSTICNTIADAGWHAGVGVKYGVDSREMAKSDLIVVWGGNPVATQVNVMTHIARARKERGAKLVVVDPYRTATAETADLHLMPRPGTDGALIAALINVMFRDGYADWDYMREYTDAPDDLAAHVAQKTPEWAAGITGIDAAEIETLARLYGATDRAYIRVGYGFTRSRNGAANMHGVTCLPSVTGKWKHEGGGALYSNAGLYEIDMTQIMGLDARDKSVRILDQSRLGAILCGETDALAGGPPVRAMLIQNTNPMVVCPESAKVRDGFMRDDLFVCVHEQFMTETAAMADIVLPATTFLEHEDIYQAGGHSHFFVTKRVIEPVGVCRPNHDVLCALARRLGADHSGFQVSAWELIERHCAIPACRMPKPCTGTAGSTLRRVSKKPISSRDSAILAAVSGFAPNGRRSAWGLDICLNCRAIATPSSWRATNFRSGLWRRQRAISSIPASPKPRPALRAKGGRRRWFFQTIARKSVLAMATWFGWAMHAGRWRCICAPSMGSSAVSWWWKVSGRTPPSSRVLGSMF